MVYSEELREIDDMISVMVIDDQKTMRKIIRQLLHQEHIDHVTEAHDGVEALKLLKDPDIQKPDVILCDLYMEGMDGMDFVHHLRHDKDMTPVLILTGEQSHFMHDVTKQAGANKILTKPISADELAKEIHLVIGVC